MEHQIFINQQQGLWRAVVPTLPDCAVEAATENEAIFQIKRLAKGILQAQKRMPLYPIPLTVEEVDDQPSLEEVVASIRAMPPNPNAVHPAQESLLDYLQSLPDDVVDPSFDAESWDKAWANVEAMLKATDQAKEIIEGRI